MPRRPRFALPLLVASSCGWIVGAATLADPLPRRLFAAEQAPSPGPGPVDREFTVPPVGRPVTDPSPARTPLIGLPADALPAGASAEELRGLIAREGVPRQPRLSAAERAVESAFADWVQERPAEASEAALRLAEASGSAEQPVFEVDGMKRLVPEYGSGGNPKTPEEFRFRLEHNHALHPTAVALARLAFIDRLDRLAELAEGDPLRKVFVTNGGCAAGKGSLTEIVKNALGDQATFGAVWDAAGEGDALENAWILDACTRRGIGVVYGYAEADPTTRYSGVLKRGEATGRVVDVLTYVNSYCDGAAVFRDFLASPAYLGAVAEKRAVAFGIAPGEFDLASLTDQSKPPFPDLRNLCADGPLLADHLAPPPGRIAALEGALGILEEYVAAAREKGKDPGPVAIGALDNALKFLDNQPEEVRALLLASHRRIFGGQSP